VLMPLLAILVVTFTLLKAAGAADAK
jgi:hypothetical protein